MKNGFMTVTEVANALCISQSFAYKVIRQLNAEMKAKGFHTIAGRVSAQYFEEKFCYHGKEDAHCPYTKTKKADGV